jgi:hypothetical protein
MDLALEPDQGRPEQGPALQVEGHPGVLVRQPGSLAPRRLLRHRPKVDVWHRERQRELNPLMWQTLDNLEAGTQRFLPAHHLVEGRP